MIRSMTGFGKGESTLNGKTITVEIKAVNHRYCDITIKMSRKFSFAEEKIKSMLRDKLKRGKIEVSIYVDDFSEKKQEIRLNKNLAAEYYNALKELRDDVDVEGSNDITLEMISKMPDVISVAPVKENEDELFKELMIPLEQAILDILTMRETEGKKLADDILMRADIVEDLKNKITVRAPEISKEYSDKLKERIKDLVEGTADITADRIALEAAIFADKANITEELVRLESHISQLRGFMNNKEETVGKKIDFLIQEMNREANTIGSKSNDNDITSWMIDLKAEIEKIREQVQNIA